MDKTTHGKFYVYALFRDDGRIFYIGKGQRHRWDDHVKGASAGKFGYRFHIIRDMQARGVEMPRIKLHEGLTESIAHEYEVALIKAIGRYPLGPLVNLTDGGEGMTGFKHTPETLAMMSVVHRGNKISPEARAKISASKLGKAKSPEELARRLAARFGFKHSPEACAKMSASRTGLKASLETREKIAASKRGIPRPPGVLEKARAGRLAYTSLETRAKISAAGLGRKKSPETRAKLSASLHGHTVSAETRAKISAARRIKPASRAAASSGISPS